MDSGELVRARQRARAAALRRRSEQLRKRALLARLEAAQTCLRSEHVAMAVAVDRVPLLRS